MKRRGTIVTQAYGARDYLEAEVAERASHVTAEEIRTTCSFARAERLLGREYHGRFLIELLQNAADASRSADTASGRSRVVVQIANGPALLVANEGVPMSAEVVIQSLGHIGATTKAEGEAIGHKGIGFKSVLQLTLTPEIYSGLQQSSPALQVGFVPETAREKIRDNTPAWDDLVARVRGLDPEDPFAAVPVLRFPHWIETLPKEVADLKERRFDTVVRLPFDERFAERLDLNADEWLKTVRTAFGDVSDQILLLLGSFGEVQLEDRLAQSSEVIKTSWEQTPVTIGPRVSREVVRVQRNGRLSSRWRLFRGTLPDRPHLEGEIAVGIRIDEGPNVETVLPAVEDQPSTPFHLFFPTRIPSGWPFLLHAYFEVDAARTSFYRGSADRNQVMLHELANLAKIAVADAVKAESLDLVSLVNLVAEASEPEDPLAQAFRTRLLDLLDEVEWIPLQDGGEGRGSDRPMNVFGAHSHLIRRIANTFPSSYIRQQTRLGLPRDGLSNEALQLVRTRRPSDASNFWETIRRLCLPGENPPWDGPSADPRFRSLIDLFEALQVENRDATGEVLDALRGNPRSRLIPTIGADSSRVLLPIPDPTESVPGRRSLLVMARVRSSDGRPLVPPGDLDVAFLPDGLLSSEAELDRAKPLGVRPFTVDNVLDRLSGIEDAHIDGEGLVRFLWQLLARDGVSGFSMRRSVERASVFNPSEWFWCRPGRGREDETARLRQRRERYLVAVPLPCLDGDWRPAGRIAFGADWANWLEQRAGEHPTAATQDRIAAYRAMEQLSPGPEALLAPPERVLNLLEDNVVYEARVESGSEKSGEVLDERQRDAQRHAFLLRLGVWEVPPIEAYESQDRNRSKFPWTGSLADKQQQMVEQDGGWQFGLHGWAGRRHHNVYLAEDYRFLWLLEEMAERNTAALVTALRFGTKLYGERFNALVFCPGCRDGAGSHTAWRHSSSDDRYPSSLAIQLKNDRWVPCTLDGESEGPSTPKAAWWHPKPPSGAALRQSPWRLVPLCGPDKGMNEDLRRLVGLNTLDEAQVEVVEALLRELRVQFEDTRLPTNPLTSGSAWQAFVGLHRLAYERLSELAYEQSEAAAVLDQTGVLCQLGDRLVYRQPNEARHDDGRFSAYVRHFVGSIPFVVLPGDRESVASRLGIARFELQLTRRGEDEGRDVTDDVSGLHGDRIAELLSIMVHHSLGTQTLDATSAEFEVRAHRIRNLQIKQLNELVVDAVAEDSNARVTIGEGSTQDLFLEKPTSASPVLFHDLAGEGWQDRLRRKIAPYLATVLENQAYAPTFALFLQGENDAEREEFLLELGISIDEVDAISARIGVVREEERQRHMQWFRSILDAMGAESLEVDLDFKGDLASRLEGASLRTEVANHLVELGGGEAVRRETGQGSALRLLAEAEVDLQRLDSSLRRAGDPGLDIRVAQSAFSRWKTTNGRRLSAVLATKLSPEDAKERVSSLEPPPELSLSIDPALPDLLSPVVEALRDAGLHIDAGSLAGDPAKALASVGGFGTVKKLDKSVSRLFNEEEQRRFFRELAAQWRREIRLLAVLARTGPAETRSTIRAHDEAVTIILPRDPSSPPELQDALDELFSKHRTLAEQIGAHLVEDVNADAPAREQLMRWAQQDGVAVDRLTSVEQALQAPRRERARELRKRSQRLLECDVHLVTPDFLRTSGNGGGGGGGGGKPPVGPITVGPGHVPGSLHEYGDEGERWALAAVVGALIGLDDAARDAAIGEIEALLRRFEGPPVDKALAHAAPARIRDLDEEERIDELSGLLHVSQYSDAFGFDLIGWLPSSPNGKGRAICLEVKSSGGEGFHLSRRQWSVAEEFHSNNAGELYAVLVVRRLRGGGVPAAMDLLCDPVALVEAGHLRREVDGYQIAYRTTDPQR